MSYIIIFLILFFIFRGVGNIVLRLFSGGGGHSIHMFSKILQDMINNMQGQQTGHSTNKNNQGHDTHHQHRQSNRFQNPSSSNITMREAYEILGVSENSSESEIKKAYLQLMSKMHPDTGGSAYFSTKLNQAKDLLLKK